MNFQIFPKTMSMLPSKVEQSEDHSPQAVQLVNGWLEHRVRLQLFILQIWETSRL